MKRIIRPQEPQLHLSDILEKITHIVICDELSHTFGMISASSDSQFEDDGEDMSDDQFYLHLPDEDLIQLTPAQVHKLSNIELLGRIAKLDSRKLTLPQKDKLREAYKKKVIVDKEDVANLLAELRECDSISYERRHTKTTKFIEDSSGKLRESECLEIIHQLTVQDYVATSKSYNFNHLGNELFVFEPDADWETADGTLLENITIYVKLDIDETTKRAVALVSMHEARYMDKHPYSD